MAVEATAGELRWLRWGRTFRLAAPRGFRRAGELDWAAVFTPLAAVIPLTCRGSRLDDAIKDYETMSGKFTNIRDRFRQAALVHFQKAYPAFEAIYSITRLEKARAQLGSPEMVF
ncbi:hypothetical protein AAFG07_34600 [Bradyrhizobium sp. B097]|uniref:hypothetical protein n=1 Tax=Bradyrhizobium sp. B097 TaxID=3140244 RepID=UPI003183ED1B